MSTLVLVQGGERESLVGQPRVPGHFARTRAPRSSVFSTSSLARPAFLNNFVENQDFDQSKKF